MTRISLAEALKTRSETDWGRLKREARAEVDPVEEDDFDWARAEVLRRPGKHAVSLRIDDDLLTYFKATGKGYQTRINAVLRAFVEAQKRRDDASGPSR